MCQLRNLMIKEETFQEKYELAWLRAVINKEEVLTRKSNILWSVTDFE